jgi:hypothetical protein
MSRWALRRALIHGFVAFHLLAIGAWAAPVASARWERLGLPQVPAFHRAVKRLLAPYAGLTGLGRQNWRMFARHPTQCSHVEAEVIFADGSGAIWTPPPARRPVRDRYYKWLENVARTRTAFLRPDAARFVARRFRDRPTSPASVTLIRRWTVLELPDPRDGSALTARLPDRLRAPEHPRSEVLFRYPVRPEDLR